MACKLRQYLLSKANLSATYTAYLRAYSSYTSFADYTLDYLNDSIDDIVNQHAGHLETDVSLHSGVLTVSLAHLGTYVINKQTPNQQIWLSSPVSGPWRFDLVKNRCWVSTKDHQHLDHLLSKEFSSLLAKQISLVIDLSHLDSNRSQ